MEIDFTKEYREDVDGWIVFMVLGIVFGTFFLFGLILFFCLTSKEGEPDLFPRELENWISLYKYPNSNIFQRFPMSQKIYIKSQLSLHPLLKNCKIIRYEIWCLTIILEPLLKQQKAEIEQTQFNHYRLTASTRRQKKLLSKQHHHRTMKQLKAHLEILVQRNVIRRFWLNVIFCWVN